MHWLALFAIPILGVVSAAGQSAPARPPGIEMHVHSTNNSPQHTLPALSPSRRAASSQPRRWRSTGCVRKASVTSPKRSQLRA
jgi:hypothetical protein